MVEFFFDLFIKKMFILVESEFIGLVYIFIKGVVECVLFSCVFVFVGNDDSIVVFMIEEFKIIILVNMEVFVCRGFCVFVFVNKGGVRFVLEEEFCCGLFKCEEFEYDLVFRGLVGIYDLLRLELWFSVFKCYEVGIGVYMLMGDYFEIVWVIVIEVGILFVRMEFVRVDIV